MTGYIIDKSFEIIGYPNGFKKRVGNGQFAGNSAANSAVLARTGSSDGITHALTSGQYNRLMILLSSLGGNPMDTQFNEYKCLIHHPAQKSLMGTGGESYGLYFYDLGKKHVNSSISVCHLSKCLWHNRLGHPADQVFEVLKGKLNIDNFQLLILVRLPTVVLSENMWPESILTATYLPTDVLSGKSPYELVYKCVPSFSHFKTFGCLCFATVLNNLDKFSARKRISDKRTKIKAKTDKTEHGMEKREKSKSTKVNQKVNPDKAKSRRQSRKRKNT
ncbi:hypothetical protein Tco_1079841 [Tanacetum coccineum]|uniref:GAG-pre-integrase domain-containing protein n=1 Tax=Tanacetum coccineum TaxID=301880 RepID=A0ABQ5HT12_9ASTR